MLRGKRRRHSVLRNEIVLIPSPFFCFDVSIVTTGTLMIIFTASSTRPTTSFFSHWKCKLRTFECSRFESWWYSIWIDVTKSPPANWKKVAWKFMKVGWVPVARNGTANKYFILTTFHLSPTRESDFRNARLTDMGTLNHQKQKLAFYLNVRPSFSLIGHMHTMFLFLECRLSLKFWWRYPLDTSCVNT